MSSAEPVLHSELKSLEWIVGKWKSEEGKAFYPTMKDVIYKEEVEFSHVGLPFLDYRSCTYNSETNAPMHWEKGFLRVNPGTNQVGLLATHNFGVTEVSEGEVKEKELFLSSRNITHLSFNKVTSFEEVTRHWRLKDDELHVIVQMKTTAHPLQDHLYVTYKRV